MPLILFNKPYGVLSQFRDSSDRPVLADYIDIPDVYPAGRLDYNSEGLLLLTDDGRLQARISSPANKLPKHYLVQVEGEATPEQARELVSGVSLKDGVARAKQVELAESPGWLWERDPPIRFRRTVPTSWLTVVLTEGRNVPQHDRLGRPAHAAASPVPDRPVHAGQASAGRLSRTQ